MAIKNRRPPKNNERRVRTTGVNNIGVTVNQNGDSVQYESRELEKLGILYFLRNPLVIDIQSQPITILFIDEDGKDHSYVPDLKLVYVNGDVEIIEFTLTFRLKRPDIARRHKAAELYCNQRGWRFRVVTEKDLPSGYEKMNLFALKMFRHSEYYSGAIGKLIKETLMSVNRISITKLSDDIFENHGFDRGEINNSLFFMIWHGEVNATWDIPIFRFGEINRWFILFGELEGEKNEN